MLISSPLRRGMVLGLLLAILARETAGNKFRVRRDDEGTCKYEGYKPGGGIPNIKDIQSPVCKGFSRTLTFVSGLLANAGNGAAKTMFKVAEVVQKGAKVAKILGGAFAAFGAAFEMVSAQSKPKPDDILKQVDKAFDAITKDINDRLKDMENYVDAKVLGLETKLVNNEFASLKKFLTNCMHETTERAVLKCQQDSVRDIDAASPKFEVFKRDFDRGQNNLNPDQIRRLEAALIPFRDYASLHLFALQTLINAYKDAPDTQEKNNRLKLYMDTLYKQGIRYNKYATWAYERIYYNQVKIHLNVERYILDKQVQNVMEGWANKVNTEKRSQSSPTA
ncbi:uncharacterized protein LOC116615294 [Nematostella vectensis]|uniref:uncharacterized protein LOC116615294 n=1 Tax=Nematostella vectensis TaxID=45351 RepID=UPI00207709D1|nr:uncharacterized protein LOC116615294 [Nematostella vectensis]XP_048576458.1 uncharacterized protein LOC116615294 [Nematostella vectensis]XP_048576459.1 uncharacterized protein LOC116615294 [Nematostella vectensis]XP_048576460.1 uncharacterized protein LOC116615294 [Nematostella vectensis]